jgi:FkbM family methyltransferase
MNVYRQLLTQPELRDNPPVLVDVGAAGGVTPVWREIAPYCIGIGFEPDARDSAALSEGSRLFGRWIYCEGLVAPKAAPGEKLPFHLTKSPHCSSLLKPRADLLQDWLFADFFAIDRMATVPAVTLADALSKHGLQRIDWLKCDTQGQDLSIFLSLPEEWRRRAIAVEFEPGLIDAYEGEDKFWHTLRALDAEPFWISHLEVCGTQRGNADVFRRVLGESATKWNRRLAPTAPGWVNVRYLRSITRDAALLDRRALLLSWLFSDMLSQHSHALAVATLGKERFGPALFDDLAARSIRRLRWSMLRRLPSFLWHRLGFS